LETFSAITAFHLHRSESRTPPGRTSSRRIWPFLAGVDFFSVEVLTTRGLATYYVLFFLRLETRRVSLAGIIRHPTEEWMKQIARNAVDLESGYLCYIRYLLHDGNSKFCTSFKDILKTKGVTSVALPPRSPNPNAFSERWVRSARHECRRS
jgi:hypothetical protein